MHLVTNCQLTVHHPGSGVNYGLLDPRMTQVGVQHQMRFGESTFVQLQASHLELLRDHCSGRLTPCCGDGALQVILLSSLASIQPNLLL